MDHAREIDLIELAAGRLASEREQAVLAHLEGCPACRTKWQDIRRTWDLLGAWQVGLPNAMNRVWGPLHPAGRGASSGSRRERRAPFILRFPGVRTAARIAAALAVSVLAGYAGGRWSIRPMPTGAATEPPTYISALGLEMGDSFSSLVLQEEPSSRQESRS